MTRKLDFRATLKEVIRTPGACEPWEPPEPRYNHPRRLGGTFSKRTGTTSPSRHHHSTQIRCLETLGQADRLCPAAYSHFGYAYDAQKKLRFYREELQTWNEIIEKGVKEGLDRNGIWESLKKQDPITSSS